MNSKKVCHICKKTFCYDKNKKKIRHHCQYTRKFRGAAHSECIVFHNGSTYDYHFIIKQLAVEFEGKFKLLAENTEKLKLKFIDSYRFMSTSLSNLVDNLSGIYDKECKKCMERKKIRLNCEFIGWKNGRLNYKGK